jgi:uncharacterized protein YbjQ (UPF0145 family)
MAGLITFLIYSGVPLMLLVIGFLSGRRIERKHMRDLDERERQTQHVVQTNLKNFPSQERCSRAELVAAEVVIASDYFKTFAASLRNFFGGEVRSLETLMDRARREARMRIVEEAVSLGANAVCNIRMETCTVGRTSGKAKAAMAEIYAYGTALWLDG